MGTDDQGEIYPPRILVQFSEPVAPATLDGGSVTVVDGRGRTVSATVTFAGDSGQLAINLRTSLSGPSDYTVRLTTALTDLAGNPLATDYSWKFTNNTRTSTEPNLYLPMLLR